MTLRSTAPPDSDDASLRPRELLASKCACGYSLATLDVLTCPECGTMRPSRREEQLHGFTADQRHHLLVAVFAVGGVLSAVPAVLAGAYVVEHRRLTSETLLAMTMFAVYFAGWLAMLRWSRPLAQHRRASSWVIALAATPILLVCGFCTLAAIVG
jgi:hypothetical protein